MTLSSCIADCAAPRAAVFLLRDNSRGISFTLYLLITFFKGWFFSFNICRYVKSNAIVLATNETTVGIGSGQPSRLDSCQIAIDKMNKFTHTKEEVVAASDAFFPFVDGIEKLVQSGVTAVVQPSGSIRDREIINFANETDTVLVFSKTRHFRH